MRVAAKEQTIIGTERGLPFEGFALETVDRPRRGRGGHWSATLTHVEHPFWRASATNASSEDLAIAIVVHQAKEKFA